jgi:Protein of unknown function (DUF1759)
LNEEINTTDTESEFEFGNETTQVTTDESDNEEEIILEEFPSPPKGEVSVHSEISQVSEKSEDSLHSFPSNETEGRESVNSNLSEYSTIDCWEDPEFDLLWLFNPEEMARAAHTAERDFIASQRAVHHEVVTTQHNAQPLTREEVDLVIQDLEGLRVQLLANDRLTFTHYTVAADRIAQVALDNAVKNDLRATMTIASAIKNAFPAAVPVAAGPQQRIKLPQVELPKFTGSHKDFPTWKDKYESMIHDNNSVPDIDKLSYLKVAVQGGPGEGIVDQFATTALNYPNAYSALVNHFEHARTNAYV